MANLKLTWDNVPPATKYDVMVNGVLVLRDLPGADHGFTQAVVPDLAPGSYEVLVIGKDDDGEVSEPSDPIYLIVYGPGFPLRAPVDVLAAQSATDYRLVDVVFSNVMSVKGYDLYVDGAIALEGVAPESGSMTSVQVFAGPGAHQVEVVAVAPDGQRSARSLPASFSMVVPLEAMEPPFLRAGVLNGHDIRLMWDGVRHASGYDLSLNGRFLVHVPDTGAGSYSYDLLDRDPGTYDFRIVALLPMIGPTVPSEGVRAIVLAE